MRDGTLEGCGFYLRFRAGCILVFEVTPNIPVLVTRAGSCTGAYMHTRLLILL